MEESAAAAEVSRATIYIHFPGKPFLLAALLDGGGLANEILA